MEFAHILRLNNANVIQGLTRIYFSRIFPTIVISYTMNLSDITVVQQVNCCSYKSLVECMSLSNSGMKMFFPCWKPKCVSFLILIRYTYLYGITQLEVVC